MSSVPADRRYSRTHEWFLPQGELVTIGITRHAADELTDITFVDLPARGTKVSAGKAFGEIESVKATSELISYVDGEVVEVNKTLADNPGVINSDAFGEGWMIRVRMSNPASLDALMDAPAYEAMLAAG